MKIYCIYWFGLLFFNEVTSLPEELKTEVRGYGNTNDAVMRLRCDYPTVIAVRNMHVTSKKISLGCPSFIKADTVYDPICTQVQEGDCIVDFDPTKREPYLECTGVIECDVGTDWQHVKSTCGSVYMTDSHIMSMDYNCIRSHAILKFNEVKVGTSLTETYISNEGFPAAMTSSSGGTCLIRSCSTGIVLGLIDLRLSTSGAVCHQSLKVIDGETTTVFDCADNNYLKYTKRHVSVTSSVYVTLAVTSSTPESFIWIDISGDRMAVYCGVSETFTPPQELDCPTTTLSTTTEPTTTTESDSQTSGPSDFSFRLEDVVLIVSADPSTVVCRRQLSEVHPHPSWTERPLVYQVKESFGGHPAPPLYQATMTELCANLVISAAEARLERD